jgi:hypothetical protein
MIQTFISNKVLNSIWKKCSNRIYGPRESRLIDNALKDTKNWHHYASASELYFYNEYFPDVKIVERMPSSTEIFHDCWTEIFPAPSHKTYFDLLYKGKKIDGPSFIGVSVDGGRALVIAPSIWTCECEYEKSYESNCAFYYIKNSREYLLNQIFQKISPLDHLYELTFPTFPSKKSADYAFAEDIHKTKHKYTHYIVTEGKSKRLRPTR